MRGALYNLYPSISPDSEDMAHITLRGMRFHAYHGTHPYEREVPQEFSVDVDLEADLSKAQVSDMLQDTIDYTRICNIVRRVMTGMRFNLLESLAYRIGESILKESPGINSITVRVCKLHPPMNGPGSVEVTLTLNRNELKG